MEDDEILPLLTLSKKSPKYYSVESRYNEPSGSYRKLGDYHAEVEHQERSERAFESNKVTYSWSNINVSLEKNKTSRKMFSFKRGKHNGTGTVKNILSNVNGVAYPGELLAILGASGSGKTTLLNALTFRSSSKLTVTGIRSINGVPVNATLLTNQSAYVQQDDLFIGCLTVKEHLLFQAFVRMDKHFSKDQRMNRVDEVMRELGLKDCENTTIGIPGRVKGISGGEMRRLSFASEVLTNPSLMFCDEPTSGLDSFMALNVMQVLKGLAKKGKTILCTVHQPSSDLYSMFDRLLFMAEGRVAFLGTPEETDVFFAELEAPCPHNFNPADYYVQLLAVEPGREESCKQAITMICDRFDQSENGVKIALEAASVIKSQYDFSSYFENGNMRKSKQYKVGWSAQFRAVLWRSWISILKNPLLIKVRLMQTIVSAVPTSKTKKDFVQCAKELLTRLSRWH